MRTFWLVLTVAVLAAGCGSGETKERFGSDGEFIGTDSSGECPVSLSEFAAGEVADDLAALVTSFEEARGSGRLSEVLALALVASLQDISASLAAADPANKAKAVCS